MGEKWKGGEVSIWLGQIIVEFFNFFEEENKHVVCNSKFALNWGTFWLGKTKSIYILFFSLKGRYYSMWRWSSHYLYICLEINPSFNKIVGFCGFKLLMVKTIHFQRSSFLFFWYIVFILGCILQELLQ